LNNTGTILTVLKRDTEAIPYFDRLLAINPDYEYAQGYRLFAKLHTCNWDNYEEERSTLIQKVRERKRTINPLAFFSISDDPADQLLCSQLFAQDRYPSSKEPLWRGEVYRHRKIRLGYLSPDFREHPVGHLMVGVIENHDRIRFETYGFSLGINDSSSLRQRFRLGFDHFFDCKEKTAAEIAQLIRAAEIDILIDLAGYTANARPEVLAMRPAPIQINYLGFPGTMGAPWMDFIIGDSIVIPADQEVYFQERVLRLPCCYLPIDDQVQVNPETPTRESMNLPSKGTIYCSFNHDYKINPRIWDIWMRLLRDDPQSTLWLMKLNEAAETNLRAEALKRDVDPKRLVFATRVPRIEDHLARYRLIDVFLDTMPYNAHSTVTDVIRSGGSVITLKGGSFASRVAASYISHSQAKTSKITDSIEEYEVSLAQVRQSAVTSNSHDHGGRLMNCAQMARHLEGLFEEARKSR
jgi:predicted O-linked N-acetylglucosamine transferase (SPINDLY family)